MGIKYHQMPIYPLNLMICKGVDYDEIVAYVKEFGKPEDLALLHESHFTDSRGRTILLHSGHVLIWLNKDNVNDVGIIAHEAFHAVEFVLEYVGIIHCTESSEAFAYLLTYIVEQIMK